MEQKNYHSSITAGITPNEAYAGIADVAGWWNKGFKGSALNTGDTFTIKFGDTTVAFEIIEAVPGKKVVWLVTDCNLHWLKDDKEWKNTRVQWELSPEKNGTRIDMTHIGITPEVECYESCVKGWDKYVTQSLFKLVTEGKGQPD